MRWARYGNTGRSSCGVSHGWPKCAALQSCQRMLAASPRVRLPRRAPRYRRRSFARSQVDRYSSTILPSPAHWELSDESHVADDQRSVSKRCWEELHTRFQPRPDYLNEPSPQGQNQGRGAGTTRTQRSRFPELLRLAATSFLKKSRPAFCC